ncbi:MAG: LacI family DNA-binding transcriptional regulator [Prevotellaceae bacterium]|nr:LacI family DNA-binding transcriptional regulator [Prevotellaceae bacterium]
MSDRIRIKDIAEKAGVSVGTVDRVLHKRPNVSKKALEKVNKALEEMEYHPNVYASALAYNKAYTFVVFIPHHTSEAYWQEIEEGANKAEEMRGDFHINVKYVYYKRFDDVDFERGGYACLEYHPDGVVIVPAGLDITRRFTQHLHEQKIPFVFLDSYMPDLRPLAFFGQDSFCSGYFAAKMLMLIANNEKQIMLMKQTHNGMLTTKQQANREVGFRHYMRDHFPHIEIVELDLPTDGQKRRFTDQLNTFFEEFPDIHHCITLNSKAHIIGEYLLQNNLRDKQVMGYDMVPKNVECLRQGSISFIIAQHGYQQGFACIDALFKAVVLKMQIEPVNYMPIELITKENCEFYRRTQM